MDELRKEIQNRLKKQLLRRLREFLFGPQKQVTETTQQEKTPPRRRELPSVVAGMKVPQFPEEGISLLTELDVILGEAQSWLETMSDSRGFGRALMVAGLSAEKAKSFALEIQRWREKARELSDFWSKLPQEFHDKIWKVDATLTRLEEFFKHHKEAEERGWSVTYTESRSPMPRLQAEEAVRTALQTIKEILDWSRIAFLRSTSYREMLK